MKFMDFCSGIGGGRQGLLNNGFVGVGHSELSKIANKTYELFYGESEKNFGNLMLINPKELPDFDLMIAGFPCQTFSLLGKREGLTTDKGLVIYGLINILKEKKVPYFLLENVKGLLNHDKGNTLKTILWELSEAGYHVEYKVLNSLNYGVPQMRERVYLVGVRKDIKSVINFQWPEKQEVANIKDFLIDTDSNKLLDINNIVFQKYLNNKYNKNKFDLNDILTKDYTIIDTRQSDMRIYINRCPTLRTSRNGILYVKDNKLKKLSGLEALLLQGFPYELAIKTLNKSFKESHILSQAGNAMTVNVIEAIAKSFKYDLC